MNMNLIKFLPFIFSFILFVSCGSEEVVDNNTEPTLTPIQRCKLDPKGGPCRAYIEKYFFNKQTGECDKFIWGGCSGVVPYDTIEECQRACVQQ